MRHVDESGGLRRMETYAVSTGELPFIYVLKA